MSKEYQRQNQWTLPQAQWNSTIWTIRDYYRFKEAIDNSIGLSAVTSDGQPHGSGMGDPTAKQGMKLASSYESRMVHIIDSCLTLIPAEYRRGVWDNIMWRKRYPDDGHRNTYGHWKQIFVVAVANQICATGEK
jgi:hypothetical protein